MAYLNLVDDVAGTEKLLKAVLDQGDSGVVVLVLIIALVCILFGTTAQVISAPAVLVVAFIAMNLVVGHTSRSRDSGKPANEDKPTQ